MVVVVGKEQNIILALKEDTRAASGYLSISGAVSSPASQPNACKDLATQIYNILHSNIRQ